jgi:xenotropic and polytropic retrovirus receptor 1
VHRRKLAGSASRGGGGDVYETELLEPLADDDGDAAAAREFFARLDAQLNKVNQFYRGKEQEFLERGRSLRRQMDILADLRAARAREDPSVASASAASGEYTRVRPSSTRRGDDARSAS